MFFGMKRWGGMQRRHQRGRSLHVRKAGGGSVGSTLEGELSLLGPSERKARLPKGLMVKPCLGVFPATLSLFYSSEVSSLDNCAPRSSTHSSLKAGGMKAGVPQHPHLLELSPGSGVPQELPCTRGSGAHARVQHPLRALGFVRVCWDSISLVFQPFTK